MNHHEDNDEHLASDISDPEKSHINHVESKYNHGNLDDPDGIHFETDEDALPPGYYKSSFFWGTMFAIGLGLFAGVAGFGYAAPVLGVINEDIGEYRGSSC
jgi:hypothetical protein